MTESEHQEFKDKFPPETKIINISGTPDDFEALLRCHCKNKEDFLKWLRQYENLSKLTFRVAITRPRRGKTVVYKAVYRCQHNTYPNSHGRVKTPHKQHTECPSLIRVTIKSSGNGRLIRSQDKLRIAYPTILSLIHKHTHETDEEEVMKYREMSSDVKFKLIDLFKSHYSPLRALEILKQNLLEKYEDDYHRVVKDTSLCPDIQKIYQLYYSVFNKEFVEEKSLSEYAKEIMDTAKPNTKVVYESINENEFVLAAIPPLMQRVHVLKLSGKTVFIDSSENMDQYNCKVFLLLCDSLVGRLPLGFLLTSSETEETISRGLKLFKTIVPVEPFGGSLTKEPEIFITEDCKAQINSFRNVYPFSRIFQCPRHILQSMWKWLLRHNIDNNDSHYLLKIFKKTAYSVTEKEFHKNCLKFLIDTIVKKYPNFIAYVKHLFETAEMWSQYSLENSGINTNNTSENATKIMKEKILNHKRAYNPVQLFKYIENDLCDYYSRNIGDFINEKYKNHQISPNKKKLKDLEITHVEKNSIFTVINKTTNNKYEVDLEIGFCSCDTGSNGECCEHQEKATIDFNKPWDNIASITPEMRKYYHWIAYGKNVVNNVYTVTSPRMIQNFDSTPDEELDHVELVETTLETNINEFLNIKENIGESRTDWSLLQERLHLLCDKWKINNSEAYYEALEKTVTYLENCRTEGESLAALNSIGTYIPFQTSSLVQLVQCEEQKCLKNNRPLTKSYRDHPYRKTQIGKDNISIYSSIL